MFLHNGRKASMGLKQKTKKKKKMYSFSIFFFFFFFKRVNRKITCFGLITILCEFQPFRKRIKEKKKYRHKGFAKTYYYLRTLTSIKSNIIPSIINIFLGFLQVSVTDNVHITSHPYTLHFPLLLSLSAPLSLFIE